MINLESLNFQKNFKLLQEPSEYDQLKGRVRIRPPFLDVDSVKIKICIYSQCHVRLSLCNISRNADWFSKKKYKILLNWVNKCQVLVKGSRVSGALYEDMTIADTLSDDMISVADTLPEDLITVADTLNEDLTTMASTISEDLRVTRWFKYDRDWFVCKQAALRSSCATLREWSHNLHPPSCSG